MTRVILATLISFMLNTSWAQWSSEIKNGQGLYVQVDPQFNIQEGINNAGMPVWLIQVTGCGNCMVLIDKGWSYQGKTYNYDDFDGQLRPYFDRLSVQAISLNVEVEYSSIVHAVDSYQRTTINISDVQYTLNSSTPRYVYETEIMYRNQRLPAPEIKNVTVVGAIADIQALKSKVDELEHGNSKTTSNTNKSSGSTSNNSKKSDANKKDADTNSDDNSSAISLALQYDAQGEALLRSNNVAGALEKFKLAQQIYYSETRAKKIQDLTFQAGATQLAHGLNEAVNKIDEAEAKLDPKQKFNWKFVGLTYESSMGGSNTFKQPALDLHMSFLTFAFALKFGQAENNVQAYNVTMNEFLSSRTLPETITLTAKGINMEALVGFSIPIKNFNIRPMYGVSLLNGSSIEFREHNNFTLNGELPYSLKYPMVNRLMLGLYYQIPKTRVGIGVNVSYLTQKKYDINADEIELTYTGSNPDYQNATAFLIGKPTEAVFHKVVNGFSLVFGIPKKR